MISTPFRHDFRSDTVTRPTPDMRAAMAQAEVGDDVFGDDPSVNRLQAVAADLLGKEAGLFVPSGTQANLIALMTHCQRGDEYIVGQQAHCYRWEAGGAAVLGSIQPQPLTNRPDGTIDLDEVDAAIKPDDAHFARTRLLALENTIGGKILPVDYLARAETLARTRGLSLHLDGARLFNAAVKLNVHVRSIARHFDSISACLSKGLGAPVGSVLVGSASFIAQARRWRKMLGGGMRQAGMLAAAGLYALEHHIARLAEDHANAARLAEGLARFPALRVEPPQTNIVFVDMEREIGSRLAAHLQTRGIGVAVLNGGKRQRWVTHLDVAQADVDAALAGVSEFFDTRTQS